MESTGTIKEHVTEYVKARLEVLKLQAVGKGSQTVSAIIVGVALAILSIFILMFFSFSAAYAISSATNRPFLGFLLVGVFYLLLAVAIVVFREKLITLPLINTLLKKLRQPGLN